MKDGQLEKTLQLFQQMQQELMNFNKFILFLLFKACVLLGRCKFGRLFHKQLIQSGCKVDVFVTSRLVNIYAKCGSIEKAWKMFNKMPFRYVVTLIIIFGGCAIHGHGKEV